MDLTFSEIAMAVGLVTQLQAPVDPVDTICLARNIYYEARGESRAGQIAVASVTLNRVKATAYPTDICEVVFDDAQFSWTRHGGASRLPQNQEAYQQAMIIAIRTMTGEIPDNTKGAVSFYNPDLANPSWAPRMKVVAEIDNHRFLR